MKICFISPFSSRGGAELSLIELVDALAPYGMECSCIIRHDGVVREMLAERGVGTAIVPFKTWVHVRKRSPLARFLKMLPHRQLMGITRLAAAIRRSGCDLVYSNSIVAGAGAIAARLAGKPHIWHLREFGRDDYQLCYDLGHPLTMFLMNHVSSSYIANSVAVAQAYQADLDQSKMHVVYNAVELPHSIERLSKESERSLWKRSDALRCILLGKYLSGKGQEDAVRSMIQLRDMGVPAELLMVGETLDQKYHDRMRRLVQRHGLADRVTFHGHSDAPIGLMNSADIVLMCSRREAFGRVTVEGMKLGKPVIGTKSGGTPEIIEDGRTGLLYEPGHAHELAAKISFLHQHPSERTALGRAARASADARFSRTEYGRNIASVIGATVGGDTLQISSPLDRGPSMASRSAA